MLTRRRVGKPVTFAGNCEVGRVFRGGDGEIDQESVPGAHRQGGDPHVRRYCAGCDQRAAGTLDLPANCMSVALLLS